MVVTFTPPDPGGSAGPQEDGPVRTTAAQSSWGTSKAQTLFLLLLLGKMVHWWKSPHDFIRKASDVARCTWCSAVPLVRVSFPTAASESKQRRMKQVEKAERMMKTGLWQERGKHLRLDVKTTCSVLL